MSLPSLNTWATLVSFHVGCVLSCANSHVAAASDPDNFIYTFSSGTDGWSTAGDATAFHHTAAGGSIDGGGYIEATNAGPSTEWHFVSPAALSGNLYWFLGGSIAFDVRPLDGTASLDGVLLQVHGAGSQVANYSSSAPPAACTWSHYIVELSEDTFVGDSLAAVLASVTAIWLRGEYSTATGNRAGLDSFALSTRRVPPTVPSARPAIRTGDIVYDFADTAQGWSTSGGATSIDFESTGGSPGGHVRAADLDEGATWYFAAPSTMHGNLTRFLGGRLTFDLTVFTESDAVLDDQVVQITSSGGAFVSWTPTVLRPYSCGWHTVGVTLNDLNFISATAGVTLEAVLASVTSVKIRGEYVHGTDVAGLDNVHLAQPVPTDHHNGTCQETAPVCTCPPDFVGETCLYDKCDLYRAMRPGLHVEYYNDYDFRDLSGIEERPDIDRANSYSLFPGIRRDYTSVVYQGFFRTAATGW